MLTTSLGDAFRAFCEREGADYGKVKAALRAAYGDLDPDSLVARFEKGLIERHEFEVELAELLSRGLARPLRPEGIVARMLQDVRIDEDMVEAVRRARRAVRTALLSNSWGVDYYPRDLLAELFEEVVISGEAGLRKPDPEAFLHCAERLGLPPEACVFVDDHEGNVEAAAGVGMRAVHHQKASETVAELERLLDVPLGRESDGPDRISSRP